MLRFRLFCTGGKYATRKMPVAVRAVGTYIPSPIGRRGASSSGGAGTEHPTAVVIGSIMPPVELLHGNHRHPLSSAFSPVLGTCVAPSRLTLYHLCRCICICISAQVALSATTVKWLTDRGLVHCFQNADIPYTGKRRMRCSGGESSMPGSLPTEETDRRPKVD